MAIVLIALAFVHQGAAANDDRVQFKIPPVHAETALNEFAKQAGVQMLFQYEVVEFKQANEVNGTYSISDALEQLLKGTGLTAVRVDKSSYSVVSETTNRASAENVKHSKRNFLAAIAGLFTASSPLVSAQDAYQSPVLEEIIVTAQKRAENLQDVPLSVTAFSADVMENRQIANVVDIAQATPNFTFSAFSPTRNEFTIRGIGTSGVVRASLDNAVVVFVDETYISRSTTSAFEFFDLKQVSVLRGPQGTLFGRNVVGGAIDITTTKPDLDETRAKAKVSFGNYNYIEAKGLLNGPLGENVAGKLSFIVKQHEGWGSDLITGQELDDQDIASIRGQLLYVPNDGLEVLISADFNTEDSNGGTLSVIEKGGLAAISDLDIRTSAHGYLQSVKTETLGVSAKVNWQTDRGSVTSITAYRSSDTDVRDSFKPEAIPNVPEENLFTQAEEPKTFTQELRYASDYDGSFNFVVGGFFIDEDIYRLECEDQTMGTDIDGGKGRFFTGVGQGYADGDRGFACWNMFNDTKGWAVFVDGSHAFTDNLTIRAGVRYSNDTKRARTDADIILPFTNSVTATDPDGNGPFLFESYDVTSKKSFDGTTPRLVLEWTPADEVMTYASVSRGFKSGGLDQKNRQAANANNPFDAEFAWNYEIGIKSQWLDQTLQLNAAIFRTDFTNLQQLVLSPAGGLEIVNAAEAEIDGGELEFVWLATDNLTISAAYGWLDAVYSEFTVQNLPDARTGLTIRNAPDNTASFAANYSYPMSGGGQIIANANLNWSDDYNFNDNPLFLDRTRQDAYSVVNASLSYVTSKENLKFTLWARNLTDELYFSQIAGGNNLGLGIGTSRGFAAPPRTYGLSVEVGL